jgi:hypothetical protein
LLAAVAAAACGGYTAPDEVVLGTSVYTQPKPAADGGVFDFKSLGNPRSTFYLDPLVESWSDGVQGVSTPITSAADTTIETNMVAYGYDRVGKGQSAPPTSGVDVGLKLAHIKNSYTYYYSYCGSYWYGWYGCYPAWGYAGSYSTVTVIMMMVDLRAGANQTPPPPTSDGGVLVPERSVLWVNGNYAIDQGSTLNQANLNEALNRAFAQSLYLDTK